MAELRVIIEDARSSLFKRVLRNIFLIVLFFCSYMYGFNNGAEAMLESFIEVTEPEKGVQANVEPLRSFFHRL